MLEGPGSLGSLWRAGELAWGSSSASYVYFKCPMYVTKLFPEVSQWHFSPLGAGEGGKRNGGVPNTSRRLLCMGSASSLMVQLPLVGGGSWGWAAESVLSWSLGPASPAQQQHQTPSESFGFSGEKGCFHSLLPTTSLAPPAAATEKTPTDSPHFSLSIYFPHTPFWRPSALVSKGEDAALPSWKSWRSGLGGRRAAGGPGRGASTGDQGQRAGPPPALQLPEQVPRSFKSGMAGPALPLGTHHKPPGTLRGA